MLTQIAKGRVYDYSHSVGRGAASGMGFSQPVAMAFEGNTVYVLNRGLEGIANVPWNKVAYGARVSIIDVGTNAGDEDFTGEFGKYGDRDGEFIWPSGMILAQDGKSVRFRRMAQSGIGVRQGREFRSQMERGAGG